MKQVLTIAGLDSLAGGGVTADIKTFEEFGTFGHVLLTCIAAINQEITIFDLPEAIIAEQLASLQVVTTFSAVKVGLLHNVSTIRLVEDFLKDFNGPIILDPVLAFKEGAHDYNNSYQKELLRLFPMAMLVTPNLFEAQALSGVEINTLEDMKTAAKKIKALGPDFVLIKGGVNLKGPTAYDVLYDGHSFDIFSAPKSSQTTTNGAGCTLSAAITSLTAQGQAMPAAVQIAKDFVLAGIEQGLPLNDVLGNVDQLAYFRKESIDDN